MRLMEDPSPVWIRADTLVLVSLLALASIIRLPHLMAPYVINMDAINYIEAAKALLRGKLHEGFGMGHASIYPILVALSYKVLGDWVTAARVFPVAFGILTVVPLYLLVRQLMDHRLAWFSGVCYAISPAILTSSLDVIRDPLVWFGFSFFVWMLLKAAHWNKWRQYLCCGVVALGCMSVRADSFLLVLAALIVAIYLGLRCGEVRRGLRNATAALLPLALAGLSMMVLAPASWKEVAASELLPYGRQIHASLGQVPPSAVEEVKRLIGESPRPRIARFFSLAWEKRWVLTGWSLLEHWVRTAHPIAFALMLMGVARGDPWRDRRWQVLGFLMALFLCIGYVRITGAFAISKRHLVPLAVLGYTFAAKGFEGVLLSCQRRWPRVGYRTTGAALASALALVMLVRDLEPIRAEKLIRRQAGEWIRTLGIPHPTVVTDHRHIGFYAEGKSVSLAELLRDPSLDAHFIACEPDRVKAQADARQRLKALGWSVTFLKEFRDDSGSIAVYALTKPENSKP